MLRKRTTLIICEACKLLLTHKVSIEHCSLVSLVVGVPFFNGTAFSGIEIAFYWFAEYVPSSLIKIRSSPELAVTMNSCEAAPPIAPLSASTFTV